MPQNNRTTPSENDSRIIYYEPNDVNKYIDGEPIALDQNELCISFDLVVEMVSRYKSNGNRGYNYEKTMNISWRSPLGESGKTENYVSFTRGDGANKGHGGFLSTFYVDDTYTDIRDDKGRVVEGLGVENIQVSFESYYTPTISIKFVDHRGSAIFAREELSHDNDEITSETVFGCFFTQPYPKFRLQIKGFFGRAVTYQLTCSSFKGSLNQQTGNFEALVTFIGYSYGIFTDVPFNYLIAAPYCDYDGMNYWQQHVDSTEWRLPDGKQMIRLYELFMKIENTMTNDQIVSKLTEEAEAKLGAANAEKEVLNRITSQYEYFLSDFREKTGAVNYITTNRENAQALFLYKDDETKKTHLIKEVVDGSFERLKGLIDEYCENYSDTNINTGEKSIFKSGLQNDWIETDHFFNVPNQLSSANSPTANISYRKARTVGPDSLTGVEVQAGAELTEEMSREIHRQLYRQNSTATVAPYAYLLNLGNVYLNVQNRLAELANELGKIEKKKEETYVELAYSNLGIFPYIGNIFKILLAHLETFVHMLYTLNDRIKNTPSMRSPQVLGIQMNQCDVVDGSSEIVPPWPMVYTRSKDETVYSADEQENNVFGWVGDFSHNFEEERLIMSLYNASYKTTGAIADYEKYKNTITYLPTVPVDTMYNGSPFSNIGSITDAQKTVSTLAGFIGMRAAQLFGICEDNTVDDETAKTLGAMDAYNLYAIMPNRQEISERILNATNGNDLSSILYGITVCDREFDQYATTVGNKQVHVFETDPAVPPKIKERRHPIFAETDDSKLAYVHYVTKDKKGLVPQKIKPFNPSNYTEYKYAYDEGERTAYFTVVNNNLTTTLHNANVDDFTDTANFRISDTAYANGVKNRYEDMKSGSFRINGESYKLDMSKVLERYWSIGGSVYDSFFKCSKFTLSKSYTAMGLKNMLWIDKKNPDDYLPNEVRETLGKNQVRYENGVLMDDGSQTFDKKSTIIKTLGMATRSVSESPKADLATIFAHRLYCSQTNDHVKAYLFLSCFGYNTRIVPKCFKASTDHAITETIPQGLALLYGAILWRKRQLDKDRKDPIVNPDGIYRLPEANESFNLDKESNEYPYPYVATKTLTRAKYVDVSYLFKLPKPIQNELIGMFDDFVKDKWVDIRNRLSLFNDGDIQSLEVFVKQFANFNDRKKDDPKYPMNDVNRLMSVFNSQCNKKNSYCYAIADRKEAHGLRLLLSDTTEVQAPLLELYTNDVVFSNAYGDQRNNESKNQYSDVTISKNAYKSYLNGFTQELKKITEGNTEVTTDVNETEPEKNSEIQYNRDMKISMYRYIKAIWDRWLCALKMEDFTVSAMYDKNFHFIDSLYRNISQRLTINCQILMDAYSSVRSNEDITLFKFMGDIASRHNCLMFALPDFIAFSQEGDDKTLMKRDMEKMFTPVSYSDRGDVRAQNYFVIVYVSNMSSTAGVTNGYPDDTLNIWSCNGVKSNACQSFKMANKLKDGMTTYGYNIPSFGVAFGRQNNHLFKSIKVNMDAPVITSASINTLSHITLMGAGNDHAIAYIGQDIYPIFSNYSYTVEVEMMGNAQIQPLMYFQLMNVPMWRGTYMIFKVAHNMTPGNMTTTFWGTKLANRCVNFSNAWFTKKVNFRKKGEYDRDPCGPESQQYANGSTGIPGRWGQCVSQMGTWYANNVNTYFGGVDNKHKTSSPKSYDCSLTKGKVVDHCSGFVCACLQLFGALTVGTVYSTEEMVGGTKFNEALAKKGFTRRAFDYAALKPGDIYVRGNGHAEIYDGNGMAWDWGNNNNVSGPRNGLPRKYNKQDYQYIWHLNG